MSPLRRWDCLTLKFSLMPAHHIHLDMRNNYNIRMIVCLWDVFLALWDVQEVKVNNKYEVVSTSRLEPEAGIL